MPLGVFDSGFGGLTILKSIADRLPDLDTLYLGDNARAPYGNRSGDAITEFTKQGVDFLFKKNCTLVIVACTTASALALRRLQQEWLPTHYPDRRILGIVTPVVEKMIELDGPGPFAVIGTRGTIESKVFEKECAKRTSTPVPLIQRACPLLVPLIEEGWHEKTPARMILRSYLAPLKLKQVTTLLLGCTHYPLLAKEIRGMMGHRTRVIEPGPIVADSLAEYLKRHPEIDARLDRTNARHFYTTDSTERIQTLAARFWGTSVPFENVLLE